MYDNLVSQIKKAHSIGSIVTMICFVASFLISRVNGFKFLTLPVIIIVSLTIIISTFYLIKSLNHKEKIEKPLNNNIAFIVRILVNVAILALYLY